MDDPKSMEPNLNERDPTTWGIPIESIEVDDPTWGKVEIQRWSQLHFRQAAEHPMEVILIQRKGKGVSKKAALADVVGLGGRGEALGKNPTGTITYDASPSSIGIGSRAQRLHWTLPKLGTPEQGQRSL